MKLNKIICLTIFFICAGISFVFSEEEPLSLTFIDEQGEPVTEIYIFDNIYGEPGEISLSGDGHIKNLYNRREGLFSILFFSNEGSSQTTEFIIEDGKLLTSDHEPWNGLVTIYNPDVVLEISTEENINLINPCLTIYKKTYNQYIEILMVHHINDDLKAGLSGEAFPDGEYAYEVSSLNLLQSNLVTFEVKDHQFKNFEPKIVIGKKQFHIEPMIDNTLYENYFGINIYKDGSLLRRAMANTGTYFTGLSPGTYTLEVSTYSKELDTFVSIFSDIDILEDGTAEVETLQMNYNTTNANKAFEVYYKTEEGSKKADTCRVTAYGYVEGVLRTNHTLDFEDGTFNVNMLKPGEYELTFVSDVLLPDYFISDKMRIYIDNAYQVYDENHKPLENLNVFLRPASEFQMILDYRINGEKQWVNGFLTNENEDSIYHEKFVNYIYNETMEIDKCYVTSHRPYVFLSDETDQKKMYFSPITVIENINNVTTIDGEPINYKRIELLPYDTVFQIRSGESFLEDTYNVHLKKSINNSYELITDLRNYSFDAFYLSAQGLGPGDYQIYFSDTLNELYDPVNFSIESVDGGLKVVDLPLVIHEKGSPNSFGERELILTPKEENPSVLSFFQGHMKQQLYKMLKTIFMSLMFNP